MALHISTPQRIHALLLLFLASLTTPVLAETLKNAPQTCSWASYGYPLQPGADTCPEPIDQRAASRKGDWTPWSDRPWCVKGADSPHYCVYTHRPFRGGAGLSLVMKPEYAASIVPSLDDTILPISIRDHPSSEIRGEANKDDLPYEIVDLPGRGKGTIAKRKIKALEIVLVDHPAMILPMNYHNELTDDEQDQILERSFEQLPEKKQEEIMALARSTGGDPNDPLPDILRTNIFGIEIKGEMHMGLFPGASRVNHHCKATTFWRWAQSHMAQEVVAIRDIEPGEEITHSYAPLGNPREYRREAIKAWGFNCTCSLCTAPEAEIKRSDARRYRLHDIHMGLTQYAASPPSEPSKKPSAPKKPPPPPPPPIDGDDYYDPPVRSEEAAQEQEQETLTLTNWDIADLTSELEQLVHAEHLWPQLCEYYKVVARAYIRRGNLKRARYYAEMAESYWIKYGGVEHDDLEGIADLYAALKEAEDKADDG